MPADATNDQVGDDTLTATSAGDPTVSTSAVTHTYAVTATRCSSTTTTTVLTCPVDLQGRTDRQPDRPFGSWDLGADPVLPVSYLNAHTNVVWFTGASYPGPIAPYET